MDVKERIMQFIKTRGPVIPADVAREIGANILIASAHLSEMTAQGTLRISNIKIGGGSPLYYASGQEHMLDRFVANLNEKNRKAYEYLKQHIVLKDSGLSPLMRVAFREIKDFARPLEVSFNGKEELFWKIHTLDNIEAGIRIREMLGIVPAEDKNEEEGKGYLHDNTPLEEEIRVNAGIRDNITAYAHERDNSAFNPKANSSPFNDRQATLTAQESSSTPEPPAPPPAITETAPSPEKIAEPPPPSPAPKRQPNPSHRADKPKRQHPPKPEDEESAIDPLAVWNEADSDFIKKLKRFFDRKGINVLEADIKRKDSDIEFILEVDSSIGKTAYFGKAKAKKKISDGDLSTLFLQSQSRKLPALMLITGEMTKKARDFRASELKGITIVNI